MQFDKDSFLAGLRIGRTLGRNGATIIVVENSQQNEQNDILGGQSNEPAVSNPSVQGDG